MQVIQLKTNLFGLLNNHIERQLLLTMGLRGQVRALSPKLTLDRGYAVVRDQKGHVLTKPQQVSKGQKLEITLAGGEIGATAD